jgi:hypothetical protein
VWAEVLGAASYTVEIEAHSGKKWVKQEKKSGLIETKYSAIIAAPEARWRVCAVDNKQKDGKQSDWATFNLIGSQESASKPVQSPNQPPQVVSK